jgi:tetratricopeptide (TPR) repeat protein
MMKRPLIFLATVLLFLAVVCQNSNVSAKDSWLSVRSKNFFLVGNVNERDLKQVAVKLEQFREVFTRLFTKTKINSPVPTTVVVFKNENSYRPFKPGANSAGYFQPGFDVNYIALTTEVNGEQNPFNIIFHEYIHLLVNNNVENPPTWFNEGLAEYYSTFNLTDDQKVELGRPIGSHVYLLRENKMLPLRTLFQVDHKSPYYNERDKQSIFYAESWALMHYLIMGKNAQRRLQMGKFLDLMGAGHVPMEQAFQQAFQTTFENMEKELREYIRQDRYSFESGRFEKKLELDTAMETAPISEAEAQAYLGDLLLHSNRADSEAYLQRALALDPNLPLANAALGMLRVREGKTDEARKSLERAAAKSQNYLIHYYYAYALSRQGSGASEMVNGFPPETAAKMRAELKKAIELRPDFPESYSLLAFVNLVTETDLDESVQLLKRALLTSRGRNDLSFMLAQIYVHKQDYNLARQLLEQLNGSNVEEVMRERAQALLAQIAFMEEQNAHFEAMRKAAGSTNTGAPLIVTGADGAQSDSVQTPLDPSSYLREVLRKPASGQTQIQATLVRIDCDAKEIVFVIKADDHLLRLSTDSFAHVEITTYSPDVSGEITCGPRKPENQVVVCFVPVTEPSAKTTAVRKKTVPPEKTDGLIRSLEFVPKDFKLKS